MPRLISELLDLPKSVHRGDFVLNLAEGVTRPEPTVEQYVVTEQLEKCFERALTFIRSALDARSSKATYLHGSFGSGKSHFMAILFLLLKGHAALQKKPELARLAADHRWIEGKRFLLVPYHMIGATNMETAILGGYAAHVRKHHPDQPPPGVWIGDSILENAEKDRAEQGDEAFFGRLNRGTDGGGDGKWGTLQGAGGAWTAGRFDDALRASSGDPERQQLVADLVERIYTAYRQAGQGDYLPLDQGLSLISQHAKTLGYDALLLFLDELILWLASHSANIDFVQREGQKLNKLVEAQSAERPVPIVSFIARQRDLRELVGERLTGAMELNFTDILKHWEGRFETITLEDRNLPTIAEKRVLKPRDASSRAELDRAFAQTTQIRDEVMDVLVTHEADRDMFRKVYPFSPALMQTLVAVSSALQRERTALKIMLQLLVDQRDTLELGQVVPVGDLWDQVAYGEEALTRGVDQEFEKARKLYQSKLLPLLAAEHGIDLEHDAGSKDPEVQKRLAAFRRDDRLIKTLLLAALVPEVESLKNLTPARLAALNHGTINSPIPGREGMLVLTKLQKWAGQVGEIRIQGESTNPTISLQLSGVDTEAILDQAKQADNLGNRQRKLRAMLFDSLGVVDTDSLYLSHGYLWRGTKRNVDIVFTNVREANDAVLTQEGEDWKLVVDFPFDQEGHNPREDVERVERYRADQELTHTLVWLPSFFSRTLQRELGKLVVLDHVLSSDDTFAQYTRHLSPQDRVSAKVVLQSQQSALRHKLHQALEASYGVRQADSGWLDDSYEMADERFLSLHHFQPQPPVGADLKGAMEHLLGQALESQYPAHPELEREVKTGDLRKVLEVVQEANRLEGGRVFVESKPVRKILLQIAVPLGMGVMGDTHFVMGKDWRMHFGKKSEQVGRKEPTVADLRRWIDDPKPRGLPRDVQDLLILSYADQTDRSITLHGGSWPGEIGKLPDEAELRQTALPSEDDWTRATTMAGHLMGKTYSRYPSASSLSAMAQDVGELAEQLAVSCRELVDAVREGASRLKIDGDVARLGTAEVVESLMAEIQKSDALGCVAALAKAGESDARVLGKSMKSASDVAAAVQGLEWELVEGLERLGDGRQNAAQGLLEDLRAAFRADEYEASLREAIGSFKTAGIRLLTPDPDPDLDPDPRPGVVESGDRTALDRAGWEKLAHGLTEKLRDETHRIDVSWTLRKKH